MAEGNIGDFHFRNNEFSSQVYDDQLINKLAAELQTDERSSKFDTQKLPTGKGSERGTKLRETDPNADIEVTVQMKSKASEADMDRVLKNIRDGKQAPLSDGEFTKQFGANQSSLDAVNKFAQDNGLSVTKSNLESGQVIMHGKASDFSKAFQTKINDYNNDGEVVRGRAGDLKIPKALSRKIEGVFGLDGSPQSQSHTVEFKPESNSGPFGPRASDEQPTSYMPNEIADAYHFPAGTTGKGQGIAIIELGGGIDMKNEADYYKEHGLKMPDIQVVEIDGAKNNPTPSKADAEVALDSQIIGAVAPDAKQMLIFAPNGDGDKGFIDAVTRATFTEAGETPNSAISISWGKPIEGWTDESKHAMNLALKKAAIKGISVFVSSGDDGAVDGSPKGNPTVDYPAADPFATATGGSRLFINDGKIDSEVTWNDKYGATGGGISPDEIPDWQKGLKMPVDLVTGHAGRGVPDIAGDADPFTGYKIRVHGKDQVNGGTSAVAPLYAALAARLNEGLGSNQSVGFLNPFLYKSGMSGNSTLFNDITSGNNNGFKAGKGWDAVTGWGSVNGEELLKALRQRQTNSLIA